MRLILTSLRLEAAVVCRHLRGVRVVESGQCRTWTGRAPDGGPVAVCCVGWGPERSARVAEAVLDRLQPEAVVNWGAGGALVPWLQVGDAVVCGSVVDGRTGKRWRSSEGLFDGCDTASLAGVSVACADWLTWPRPVFRRGTRVELARRYGCGLVEMESAALCRLATERGVPFAALRVVSDALEGPRLPSASYLSHLRESFHDGARCLLELCDRLENNRRKTRMNADKANDENEAIE